MQNQKLSALLLSRPQQVDRELERARQRLEQSEDSRESLVQQVCHSAVCGEAIGSVSCCVSMAVPIKVVFFKSTTKYN